MKQDIFNGKRFLYFVRKEYLYDRNFFLRSVANFCGFLMLLLIFASVSYYKSHHLPDVGAFTLGFIPVIFYTFGCKVSSVIMTERLSMKTSRIADLMIPVTNFEKYIIRWFFCTIGYPLFLAISLVFMYILIFLLASFFPQLMDGTLQILHIAIQRFLLHSGVFFMFMILYLYLQSFFILGGTFWQKKGYQKTSIALIVIVIIIGVISYLLNMYIVLIGPNCSQNAQYLLILLTLVNWVASYIRLARMEIINNGLLIHGLQRK
jgi:hypothetical protein